MSNRSRSEVLCCNMSDQAVKTKTWLRYDTTPYRKTWQMLDYKSMYKKIIWFHFSNPKWCFFPTDGQSVIFSSMLQTLIAFLLPQMYGKSNICDDWITCSSNSHKKLILNMLPKFSKRASASLTEGSPGIQVLALSSLLHNMDFKITFFSAV